MNEHGRSPQPGATVESAQSAIHRRHLRGSSLMVAGRMIAMVVNLVVQVAAIQYLDKSDFGAFAYGLAAAALVTNISLWGQDQAIARYLPRYEGDGRFDLARGVVGAGVVVVAATGILVAVVVALLHLAGISVVSSSEASAVVTILLFLAPIVAIDELFQAVFAAWSRPKAIFWRRHVATPLLRLASVLGVIVLGAGVEALAVAYVVSGLIGLGIYLTMASQLEVERERYRSVTPTRQWREQMSFALPVHLSSLMAASREPILVIILGAFWSTDEVASYRAVVPFAMINLVGMQSFRLMYLPTASKLFGDDDRDGVRELYWRSASWLAVGTFPIFLVTFSLAPSVTTVLLGSEYADSASSLALLSVAYYFTATLGLNSHTLRASGQVRLLIGVDIAAFATMLVSAFVFVPSLGAMGVVVTTLLFVLVQNVLTQVGLWRALGSLRPPPGTPLMYGTIVIGAASVAAAELTFEPPLWVGMIVATLVSLVVLRANRSVLAVADTLPEVRKIPLLGRLAG